MTYVASFSDAEAKLIRAMAQRLDKGGSRFSTQEIASFCGGDHEKAYQVAERLKNHGLLDAGDCLDEWQLKPLVMSAVYEWDNPPAEDYWNSITRWFRSKWWSIPVLVVFICLPLIVQWIEMIQSVLLWLGITRSR